MTFSPSSPASRDTYWELDATVVPASEEVWNLFCFELGALGAEVLEEDREVLLVRHFFQTAPFTDAEEGLSLFHGAYPAAEAPSALNLREQPTQPWETAWRDHFTPIPVGERICVRPPWHEAPPPQDSSRAPRVEVVIHPGQGFGTGWHPTTHLALLALEALLTAEEAPLSVLDVGTGSGILAIAARLLGVRHAHGIDVDEQVLEEVRANFAHSGLPAPDSLAVGTPEGVPGSFPLVIANITAPVLLAHCEDLARLTERGGWLIVSGVLEAERAHVQAAFAAQGLHPVAEARREGWWCATLRHESPPRNSTG